MLNSMVCYSGTLTKTAKRKEMGERLTVYWVQIIRIQQLLYQKISEGYSLLTHTEKNLEERLSGCRLVPVPAEMVSWCKQGLTRKRSWKKHLRSQCPRPGPPTFLSLWTFLEFWEHNPKWWWVSSHNTCCRRQRQRQYFSLCKRIAEQPCWTHQAALLRIWLLFCHG